MGDAANILLMAALSPANRPMAIVFSHDMGCQCTHCRVKASFPQNTVAQTRVELRPTPVRHILGHQW